MIFVSGNRREPVPPARMTPFSVEADMARKRSNGPSARREFLRADHHAARLAPADHAQIHVGADPILAQQPLQIVDPAHRFAVDRHHEVLRAQAGARGGRPPITSTTSTALSRPTSAAIRGGSGRAPPAIPIHARRTRPSRIRAQTIRRVVVSIGIASPRRRRPRRLIPTTSPVPLTSAPPELPGFSAASVWIHVRRSCVWRCGRARAASARARRRRRPSPIRRSRAGCRSPRRAGRRAAWQASPSSAAGARRRRVQRAGGRDRRAGRRPRPPTPARPEPSVKEARTRRPSCRSTWALVSMNPSGVMTTPDPVPRRATRRFATDGPSFSATETTTREYASRASISVVTYEMIVRLATLDARRKLVACTQRLRPRKS